MYRGLCVEYQSYKFEKYDRILATCILHDLNQPLKSIKS